MENRNTKADAAPKTLTFRYLKSPMFRVIHVDGVWGGLTGRADIHMVIYSERPSIPDSMTHQIEDDGTIGDVIKVQTIGGVVREVEADIIMDYPTAKALHEWLTDKVNRIEEMVAKAAEEVDVQ